MKQFLIFLALFFSFDGFANINFIDISKIAIDSQSIDLFNTVKENQNYYSQWTNKWDFEVTREEVIQDLRDDYAFFSKIEQKNTELHLLLGDISHYLYNLDDTLYYRYAVRHYEDAIKSDPKDYRGKWFLGYHYALSNLPNQAIEQFFQAQEILPKVEPAEFWSEYAWSMLFANMPSHCIFAMDKEKKITGETGLFEKKIGASVYKKIAPLDPTNAYKKEDIWTSTRAEKPIFTAKAMGLSFFVDSTWNISVFDYKNRQTGFLINPPSIKTKKEKDINYNVMGLMKKPNEGETLEGFLEAFISKYPKKNKVDFSKKYEKMLSWELKDKKMYKEIGGAHLYIIGIEKEAPQYPGLLFEKPLTLPKGKKGEASYYTPPNTKSRIKGNIFYVFILDSCEEIHEESLAVFKSIFENQIIIE